MLFFFFANNEFYMYDPIYKELYNIKIVLLLREVEACNKSLKHGKSCGIDTLLKEYFLEAGDILLSHVTDLFLSIIGY